jgi:hypothetical protein
MYMAVANEMTDKKLFNAPTLVDVIGDYKSFVGEKA